MNKSDDATLKEQNGDAEQNADNVLPNFYGTAGAQVVFADVNEESSNHCADNGSAAADGHPDYHADGVGDSHLGRSDTSVEVHENSTCNARKGCRKNVDEGLVAAYGITGEISSVFTVANSDQNLAEFTFHQEFGKSINCN